MNTRIRNAIETIGTPLLVLVLVFSLVATPALAAFAYSDSFEDETVGADWTASLGSLSEGGGQLTADSMTTGEVYVYTTAPSQTGDWYADVDVSSLRSMTSSSGYIWFAPTDSAGSSSPITGPSGSLFLKVNDAGTGDMVFGFTSDGTASYENAVSITANTDTTNIDKVTVTYDASTQEAVATVDGVTSSTLAVGTDVDLEAVAFSTSDMMLQLDSVSTAQTQPPANTAPVADAGADITAVVNESVSFNGSGSSDADGDALTYSWDFDADGVEDATEATASYTYDAAGTYTVDLTVSDGTDSASDSLTVTVEEANTAPVIDSGLDPATNITATVNESVTFDAGNSTDADGDALTYSWDFDGDAVEDSANATASYTYDAAGTYTVDLTVSDGTDSVTESYTVVVEESTEDSGADDGTETPTDDPAGGGSVTNDLSTESILAVLGAFGFAVIVVFAIRRIA